MTNHQDKELSSEKCVCGEPGGSNVVHRTDGPCYIATSPQLPVAQMSGDATIRPTYYVRHPDGSFSVADPQPILRRYCAAQPQPVHMQVDMRQMLVNIAHHWGRTITPDDESMFAEFITLAASHPSNAAGQDAPIGYTSDYAIAHLDQAREGNHPAQTQVPLQAGSSFQYSVPVYRAATVPQVVQAPVARVAVHKTGGNAGIAWSATPLEDAPLMRDGELLYAAMQPGAASPSIVPSDEQIIECWNRWQEIPVVNDDEAVIKCFRELLTTASNAGEAAQGEK